MIVWRKILKWGTSNPYRKAITAFVIYIPIFCILRLFLHPQRFLNNMWLEIAYAVIGGLFTASVVLGINVIRQKDQE